VTYRFGEFELSERLFELRRGGAVVPVQPKVLDLLIRLVRHRDRVVSKDELLAALWPGVVVTDASLSKAVSAARRALGGGADDQRHVLTVRGRGFRFVAAVEEYDARAPEPVDDYVGRTSVLDALQATVAAVRDGAGRLVLLSGAAGMGKSRTAREAAAHARRARIRVVSGWCQEGGGSPALWPWLVPLRELLGEGGGAALADDLGEGVVDLAELVPALRLHTRAAPRGARVDPEQARFRLIETAAQVFRRATGREGLLVLLDDLHWADRGSLALLAFLARNVPTTRMILLAAYREEELGASHPLRELARQPGALALRLTGLEPDEVARLVALETGERVSAEVTSTIHERTAGNPFFVKELARTLHASGRLHGVPSLATLPLPAGVRDVLRLRLDRLSPGCRDLLVPAALLGPDLDVAVLSRIGGLAPSQVLDHLDEARAAGVVIEHDGRLRFAHALFRDALLDGLAGAERARLHRRIGEGLEAHHGLDLESHVAELAYHFCAGAPSGGADRALDYARRAGEQAARLLSYDAAAAHYARALEVQALLPAGEERVHGELLLARGEAQVAAGEPDDGRETLRRAASLARRLPAPELLARTALAMGGPPFTLEVGVEDPELVELLEEALAAMPASPSALRVRLLVRLAAARVWSHAWGAVGPLLDDALAGARVLGDPETLGYVLYLHRWSRVPPDELEAKLADSDEILRLARESRHRELELAAQSCRLLDLVELGRVAEADRALGAYEALVSVVRVPRYRWRARFYRAMRALLEGRFADAEALVLDLLGEERRFAPADAGQVFLAQLVLLRREQGRVAEIESMIRSGMERFPTLTTWRAALALLHADAGRLEEARGQLEMVAADDFGGIAKGLNWVFAHALLAEVCGVLGDVARAGRLYEVLRPCAPRTVMLGAGVACSGALDRVLGLLAATTGAWDAAGRHFEAALEMNTRIGARPWVGWTQHDWAWMLLRRDLADDRERARGHLDQARAIAGALGMVRLAERTAALAAHSGASS
jgi:DNA-binding winged helix-turn-helix (wHTH) protein/tetratricopeptide (TPR) repeat protein